jgi:hypothetical protein
MDGFSSFFAVSETVKLNTMNEQVWFYILPSLGTTKGL